MAKTSCPVSTTGDKIWNYQQYYKGEVDDENRKNGQGENYWSGPESLELYTGEMLMDCMHGVGEYRSRYRGEQGVFVSYEGHLYANRLHGYGAMSYPDGDVFTGLFYEDVRWGPGIQSKLSQREDVGFWRGTQLVRLAWHPSVPNVALDLYSTPEGRACVDPHRVVLTRQLTPNRVNSAIELLKECGADPKSAAENWTKLYPTHCSDPESQLCYKKLFDDAYYKGKNYILEEVNPRNIGSYINSILDEDSNQEIPKSHYSWNKNEMMMHMMKHSYQHDAQRTGQLRIDLKNIISGSRNSFKRAAQHEYDSRTLLLASYLGQVANVTQLVNVHNVHPDIADSRGNTALMYAACGDQVDIIYFLKEAGANINSVNDNCCTPLGVCLVRYACEIQGVSAKDMLKAILPPATSDAKSPSEPKPDEWHFKRKSNDFSSIQFENPPIIQARRASNVGNSRISSVMKRKDVVTQKRSTSEDADGEATEDTIKFLKTNTMFCRTVNDLFSKNSTYTRIHNLFAIDDMSKHMGSHRTENTLPSIAKPLGKSVSKLIKGTTVQPSQDFMREFSDELEDDDETQIEKVADIMLTILQLLRCGADLRLVRCPKPALFIAMASGCSKLVRHLINYGADVHEVYPEHYNYTLLDMTISRPYSSENIDIVRVLLESGARADKRLRFEEDTHQRSHDHPEVKTIGPNLLHVLLLRKSESDVEEDFRRQLLELLLEYNSDPMGRFRGKSAVDMAMSKSSIFEIFLKSPFTDLNGVINDKEQTALVKLFSLTFYQKISSTNLLQMITNLLLYGADPFRQCQNAVDVYQNVFVFARKQYDEMMEPILKEKVIPNHIGVYRQALDLMADCARMLRVRWLQAKLLRGLLDVVVKYKHRTWNMIMPEFDQKKACGLWLSATRALEIWSIFKTNKKYNRRKIFCDNRVRNHMLCIVMFFARINSGFSIRRKLTAEEKYLIDAKVKDLLQEHNASKGPDTGPRLYVMPELFTNNETRFDVCFECGLPFDESKIECCNCKLVSFCSHKCMKANIEHIGCHPCSKKLKTKYFSFSENEVESNSVINTVVSKSKRNK